MGQRSNQEREMTVENNTHHLERFLSWNGAARIYQPTVRVPWIRLASICCFAICSMAMSIIPQVVQAAPPQELVPAVQAHLAAGEFGPALDLALTAPTAEQKTDLLLQVTAAQLQSGDTTGVRQSLRRVPAGKMREDVSNSTQRQMAGGGSFANPQPLMMLIMQLTGGEEEGSPWQQISGEGGRISWSANGVWVDANGVLSRRLTSDSSGKLADVSLKARNAAISQNMKAASKLRFVSLARLERAVAGRLKDGLPVLETMRNMAGLSRIQYVIVVPEENDVLLAGPAEGWRYNDKGVAVSLTDGRPTLHLDDLVTVLRTFTKTGDKIFGCSINPRQEGLKAVKEFVEGSQNSGPLAPGATKQFLSEIKSRMGLQDVEIYGVPANSDVARVLVAADYRMKLIGIGKLEGGKEIPSIFELLPRFPKHQSMPLDALRWWLTMNYDSILHSPDRQVYEIRGSSVQVKSADQFVKADGTRVEANQASPVNQLFAENFTKNYSELAKRDLVFAELQNVFDLGMVAALLQTEHLAQKAKWTSGCFATDGNYETAKVAVSKTVDSAINHRVYNDTNVVVQVAGGVRGDVLTLARETQLHREAGELQAITARAKPVKLPAGSWWWDAGK
jgi:hypothetical protein